MLNIIGNIILSATSAVATVVSQVILENLRFWLPFERTEKQDKELVTNGDFSSEGNWIYNGSQGYSISNGTLSYDGSSTQYKRALQNLKTKVGAQYELTITIDSISTGSFNFGFGSKNLGSFSGNIQQSFSSVGTHKRIMTATSNENSVVIQNNVGAQTFSISNVSVKEITQVVPDASRGLTENVGSELNDGTWNANGGWSVSNGVATNDGTGSTLTNFILTEGKVYRMTVKFSSYTSGNFSMFLGVNSESFNFDGTDEFTFTAQCTGDTVARIKSKNTGIGSINISDISIKELTYSDIGPIKNPATLFTGKTLDFDGVNDRIKNNNHFPIYLDSGSWTVAAWFNVDELQDSNSDPIEQCIFNNAVDADNRFGISIKEKTLIVNRFDSTNGYINVRPVKSGVATLTKQTWQRIVAVIVDGNITVYLDGEPGQQSTSISPYRFNVGFTIGDTGSGSAINQHFFGGKIADVQVYNAAWTAEDALYDYQNPNHLVLDNPSTNILPNNLRGYFPLNEGSGSLAINSGYNEELSIVDENLTNTFENYQNRFGLTIVSNLIAVSPDTVNNQFRIAKKKSTATSLDVGEKYLISFTYSVNAGGSIEFKTDDAEISLTPSLDATNQTINEFIIESGSGNYNFTFGPTTAALVTDIEIQNVVDRDTEIDGAVYNNGQSMIPQLGMMDYTYNAENLLLHNEDISNAVWTASGITRTEYIKDLPPGVSQAWKLTASQPTSQYCIIFSSDNLNVTANGKAKGIWAKTVSGSGKVALNVFNGYFAGGTLQYLPVVTNEWQFFQHFQTNSNDHYYAVDFRHPDNELTEVIIAGPHMTSTDANTNILKPYIRATSSHPSGASIIQDPKNKGKDSFNNSIRLREHSFNLDGTGYAHVAESTSLNIGSGPFTLEAWVKAEFVNTGSSVNVIWVLDGNNSITAAGNVGLVTFDSNKIGAYVSGVTIDSLTTFIKGQWYHVALGRTPSGISSLYINGDLAAIPTSPSAVSLNTAQPKVGIDNTSTRYYKQLIDDVRLYNRLLTTDEIEQNYLAGLDTHTVGSSFSDDFSSDYGN